MKKEGAKIISARLGTETSEKKKKAIEVFQQLSAEDQEAVLRLAQYLAERKTCKCHNKNKAS